MEGMMDEHLLSLLEELSLRSSPEELEKQSLSSNCTPNSNFSSPTYEQVTNSIPEDVELKNAVHSLFQELKPSNPVQKRPLNREDGYDKSKLLIALLGNVDLVTNAIKKINQVVSIGKRMEQIYKVYFVNPNAPLDLREISELCRSFWDLYNSESYIRQVNVSRVYKLYCEKLIEIYNSRTQQPQNEDKMVS